MFIKSSTMNLFLQLGTSIVVLALVFYSVAIITEQRKKKIHKMVLLFLTLGVCLDISATTFMVLGSSKGGFTFHGILGYSSLAAMFTDAVLIWHQRLKNGTNAPVPRNLHLYSRYAYLWWIISFITGGLLVAFR